MGKILGNIATTTTPRSDWAQTDRTKVDFILNKPDFDGLQAEVSNIAADVKTVGDALNNKISSSGWSANKYLGTDENGNIVEKTIVSATIDGEVLIFNAVATASVDDEKLIL